MALQFYRRFAFFIALMSLNLVVYSQDIDSTKFDTAPAKLNNPTKKNWYDVINYRGYTQIRYNRLLETNPLLECEQCDRSWGGNNGFFIRRARMIFFGNLHDRVYMYIQPDFASAPSSSSLHFVQLRDAYFDISLDKKKEFRFRVGQSKVPFGFENLQSSQNRLPLDRNDGLNSAVANERDLGVFFYWAPAHIRERFSYLVSSGLKGSGDYGVFGFGAYNGQTANRPEVNDNKHLVVRLTYPFLFSNGQIIEPGIQAYTGKFVLLSRNRVLDPISNKEVNAAAGPGEFLDRRAAASFVLYPQPFGIQAEYNYGVGPEYNPFTNTIEQKNLQGGYVQFSYMIKTHGQIIIPFTRTQYYEGGKKHEIDARRYIVKEQEFGIEWQPIPNFELVTMYTLSDRTFEDAKNSIKNGEYVGYRQKGGLMRIQLQINF